MSDDWISFEGQVVSMPWGDAVYTVLPLPPEVTEQLRQQDAKRVEGEINDHPINAALSTAPVIDATFLWTGKTVLKACNITPGEILDVRLRKVDPDHVEVADDVLAALRAAEATDAWDALTPGKQRGLLYLVNTAKRADTRARRIATLVKEVRAT